MVQQDLAIASVPGRRDGVRQALLDDNVSHPARSPEFRHLPLTPSLHSLLPNARPL